MPGASESASLPTSVLGSSGPTLENIYPKSGSISGDIIPQFPQSGHILRITAIDAILGNQLIRRPKLGSLVRRCGGTQTFWQTPRSWFRVPFSFSSWRISFSVIWSHFFRFWDSNLN
jgi:hypothetical protein